MDRAAVAGHVAGSTRDGTGATRAVLRKGFASIAAGGRQQNRCGAGCAAVPADMADHRGVLIEGDTAAVRASARPAGIALGQECRARRGAIAAGARKPDGCVGVGVAVGDATVDATASVQGQRHLAGRATIAARTSWRAAIRTRAASPADAAQLDRRIAVIATHNLPAAEFVGNRIGVATRLATLIRP